LKEGRPEEEIMAQLASKYGFPIRRRRTKKPEQATGG